MFFGCTRDLTEHTGKVKLLYEKNSKRIYKKVLWGMKPSHPTQLPIVSHKEVKHYQIFLKR